MQFKPKNNLMNSLEDILANPLHKLLKIFSIPEVILKIAYDHIPNLIFHTDGRKS